MEFGINDFVKILNHDEWYGREGIITHIVDDCYAILCIQEPIYRYYVKINEAESKLLKVND